MTNFFSKRRAVCAVLFAALTALAPATQAAQLTFDYEGPLFTTFSNTTASANFMTGDRVTGSVSFDDSLLASNGSGVIRSSSSGPGINTGLTWSFEDGHNLFNNTNTTTNFNILLAFAAFEVASWTIDTTLGVTGLADIFERGRVASDSSTSGSIARTTSWFNNESADGRVLCPRNTDKAPCQPWSRQVAAVPLPAGFPLMLAGLGAFYWVRRRQA